MIGYCHLASNLEKNVYIVLSIKKTLCFWCLFVKFFWLSLPKPSVFLIIITTENVDNNTKGGKVYTVLRQNNKILCQNLSLKIKRVSFCFEFGPLRCASSILWSLNAFDIIYMNLYLWRKNNALFKSKPNVWNMIRTKCFFFSCNKWNK